MIKVQNLTKYYSGNKAIENIDFIVNSGEIVGLLGPNGAGKTTTMNIITGYLYPSSGSVEIDGLNVHDYSFEIKKKIGYLPENPPVYPCMTVNDFLLFTAEIKEIPADIRSQRLSEALEMTSLTEVSRRLIGNLSKGYKQRVGLAQALIHQPEILVLDEPTVGLDPKQIIEIRDLIRRLSNGRTIILSSHILPEVSALCQRIVILNDGDVVAVDTHEELIKRVEGVAKVLLEVDTGGPDVHDRISKLPDVIRADIRPAKSAERQSYVIESDLSKDIRPELFNLCAKNNWVIYEMTPVSVSLEEVFLKLTTRENI